MAKIAREIEDLSGSRTVLELELNGSKGYNDDFFDFQIENGDNENDVIEFEIFLREDIDFENGWAEFILVLQHEKSNWEAFPGRDFRKLQKRSWCRQSYNIPEGVKGIRCVKLILNSEREIHGRILISHPILRDSSVSHWKKIGLDRTNDIIGMLSRSRLTIPSMRRLKDLADFKSAAEKLPEINALRLGSSLPEEEAILRELPKFKSILSLERGGGKAEDETFLALPRFDQEGRVFDIILINPLERFELLMTESYHSFHILAINGLLVIHDAQLPAVNRVIRFLLTNRSFEFPCLTPPDYSNAIFLRKHIQGQRSWDHFEFF